MLLYDIAKCPSLLQDKSGLLLSFQYYSTGASDAH